MFDTLDSTPQIGAFTLSARIEHDDTCDAPWEREDGHGPVSPWRHGYTGMSGKRPGELVLNHDGNAYQFYDFAEAVRIARREGWNTAPYDTIETPAQRASRAARADFDRLRAWCNDQWSYVGVVVTVTHTETSTELASASLWGIESDDTDGLLMYANELADEALTEARDTVAALTE